MLRCSGAAGALLAAAAAALGLDADGAAGAGAGAAAALVLALLDDLLLLLLEDVLDLLLEDGLTTSPDTVIAYNETVIIVRLLDARRCAWDMPREHPDTGKIQLTRLATWGLGPRREHRGKNALALFLFLLLWRRHGCFRAWVVCDGGRRRDARIRWRRRKYRDSRGMGW